MTTFRNTVAWVCLISSCISGLYNGIYKMIYKAVINACALCDAGILTTQVIAETIFSILCSPIVICLWAFIGHMLFAVISEYDQSANTIKHSATQGTINIVANRQMSVKPQQLIGKSGQERAIKRLTGNGSIPFFGIESLPCFSRFQAYGRR